MISFICAVISDPSDQEFILNIYDAHTRFMFSVAGKAGVAPSEQEEIVQESMLQLIDKIDVLRTLPPECLITYVKLTVRSKAYSYFRRKRREKQRFIPWSERMDETIPSNETPVETRLLRKEDLADIREGVASLSEDDQFLFEGRYRLHYTDQELAECLGCKPDSVRMKLSRVRNKIRKYVADKYREEGPEHGKK